jgi:hypothetical protein
MQNTCYWGKGPLNSKLRYLNYKLLYICIFREKKSTVGHVWNVNILFVQHIWNVVDFSNPFATLLELITGLKMPSYMFQLKHLLQLA